MSISYIPEKIKFLLWGKSAGRCEYDGCNKPLWFDSVTKFEFNTAYIAHIIADRPEGPRGDPILSEQLKDDLSNLMLLCDEHHRLIDREKIDAHPPDVLRAMKEKHERRVELLTCVASHKASHVLLYGANIGVQNSPVSWERTASAILPHWYPAENHPIELGLKNSSYQDNEPDYWQIERENLTRLYIQKVKNRLISGDIVHLSIFALAPQPLLIELGRLLSDIPMAQVYQLHREPPDWVWQEDASISCDYLISQPDAFEMEKVALVLSLSATIMPERITDVLGNNVAIWMLTIDEPNNDFLKSRTQLADFRKTYRKLLDVIKARHGQNILLHIFPAVPTSVAVEMGRVWMPKADLSLRIYDQNRQTGGFTFAIDIE